MESLGDASSDEASFAERISQIFRVKAAGLLMPPSRSVDSSVNMEEVSAKSEACNEKIADENNVSFEELLKTIELNDRNSDVPTVLQGGVLIDQSYVVASGNLNALLFSPSSNFWQSLAEVQGTTGLQFESWRLDSGGENLKRTIRYTKAATKLVKAVTATEEQIYLKADGRNYTILTSVSTADVPYGNCFKTEILFCIMAGQELPSGEHTTRLVISWRMNFLQSTMMKGIIENGARQGLKESYAQFFDLLSKNIKPLEPSTQDILTSLQPEQESDWKLACRLFGNLSVISFVFATVFVIVHICLANPSTVQGLEFSGLDLPDSIGEILVCAILVLQGQHLLNLIGSFFLARKQKGRDHGVKAHGDGWILTIALIKGVNIAAVDLAGYSDPYVVFTCNNKTKTSSIKFQTMSPQWNEIFEFDAMDDPPSTMRIDVYDFDGPFDKATSLGHAEVNFVKSNLSDLADVWIPLHGKLAQACNSKLHLRIFLNNTRGMEVVTKYLTKMEKEAGIKMNVRSPQTNSAFQKLFALPPEEFLINDFTCYLKRKIPIQGRLFLSPRILGFHSNLFGHKTKFFFLWEDIDDVQMIPPSLASMGSPSLLIILHKGRGMDSKHGAKALEPDGRLRFHFHSFVYFNVANRTIMALWKARALSPEQKMQIVEEQSRVRNLQSDDIGSFLGMGEANMSDIFSSIFNVGINLFMQLFEGSSLEKIIMEKVGCVDYSSTPWEAVKSNVYQRQIHYKFGSSLSQCGGEATSTQQKSPLPDKRGWLIEEVMALQGVLLGDYFNLHLRYQVEELSQTKKACSVHVALGIAWLKSTKHQKRLTKNVMSNSSLRIKQMFSHLEDELRTVT